MTTVSGSAEIDATPGEVWAVVADPRNLPRWSRFVSSVEDVPEDGLDAGRGYTTVMRFMAVRTRVRATVVEWEPPSRSVVRLSGLVDATVTSRVSGLPGNRSRLEHHVEYRFGGGPLGELAARSLRLIGGAHYALRRGLYAQKRQIEGG